MKFLKYCVLFIISVLVNAAIAFLILPTFAKCDCLYNDVKQIVFYFGSVLASGIVVYLTHQRQKNGTAFFKDAAKSLLWVALIFILINIAKEIILINFFQGA